MRSDARWAVLAVAVLFAATMLASRGVAPAVVVPLILVAGAAVLLQLARQTACERLAAQLFEEASGEVRLVEALPRIAARLDAFQHRADRVHPVTGLPTRERLFAQMEQDIAAGCGVRLLGTVRFADFDRLTAFDGVAANSALATLAARLRAATAATHGIAQVDRDCFAIWFRGDAEPAAVIAEFRAIVYMALQEIPGADRVLTPTIEAGMAFRPDDGDDPVLLLTRSMVALARPQTSDEGEVTLVRPPSIRFSREQFALEQDLARAIDEDQLDMVFQPVVDLAAGRIASAEALLRWDHPMLGAVSPARFIPLVETIGLSDRYGAWVLNTALREAKRWRRAGLGHLRVAVNLSACQLLDPALLIKIERTLQRHGLGPDALELELTETAAMADAARTLRLFSDLRRMGVSLAIDDFGSGYSSLSYLKNLPFDKLKIDREFVRGADARRDSLAICKALIELGRGLDLGILAEGVEEAGEVAALHALGCTLFQGYFFSRPLAGDAFLAVASDPDWIRRQASPVRRQSSLLEKRLTA